MAFTGKRIKGSKQLTPETVENSKKIYDMIQTMDEMDSLKASKVKEQLFYAMFNHLSHSAQKIILEQADAESWKICMSKAE